MDPTAAAFFFSYASQSTRYTGQSITRWVVVLNYSSFEACELVDLIDTFDGSALDVWCDTFQWAGKIWGKHAHCSVSNTISYIQSFTSCPSTLKIPTCCQRTPPFTIMSHVPSCIMSHACHVTLSHVSHVTFTPAPCPSQWPTEPMQLLGLSTSNTAAFPLKTIIG